MATVEECRAALARLTTRLAANAAEVRAKADLDRTIVCRITDLGIAFRGRLRGGELTEVDETDDPVAQIVLTAASDDLVALVNGELDPLQAVASRRLAVDASPFDLWKLRTLR